MNINRSYLRVAIIAIVVMIGTISAAYAAPLYISGDVLYENGIACNEPTVTIINRVTEESWAAEKNETSNRYWRTIDSNDITVGVTLRFKSTSPDESQSRTTDHKVTQEELDDGILVHNIELTDTIPPKIHSVVLTPTLVGPNGSISVAVNATDGAGVANVTANGNELTLVNGTWKGTITAESTSDTYIVTVFATDTYDNVGEHKTKTYEVDATAPGISSVVLTPTVVGPNGSISVAVTATDASGVANVTANGEELTLVNDIWEGTITAESAAGTYIVNVVATDTFDNVGEHNTETYKVDTTSPEITSVEYNPTMVGPNGSISVAVKATDSESDIVNVTANGKELTLVNGIWKGTIMAESAAGTYTVTVVATDASNNVAEDNSKTYEVDATPPEILSVVLDPTVVEPNGSITVTVNVTDESGVANVTANNEALTLDNGTWKGTITAESTSGVYNVTVVATDAAGNVAEDDSKTYEVDATAPVITSVDVNSAVVAPNGSITVTVTVTDESGVANVTANNEALTLDNGTWKGTITAESTSGVYNVTVVATDTAGNEAKDDKTTYKVEVTDTPPVIVSVEINPAVVAPNGSITVTVNVTDESGVASVTANNEALTLDNGTWKGTITAESTSGVYNVTVVATDTAGNEAKDDKTTYKVEVTDTPPVIVSVEINPAVVAPNGSITVTVNVTDESGVASVTANNEALTLDNGTWKGMITAESTSGVYNVTVVATDTAGNEAKDDKTTYKVEVPKDTVLHIPNVIVSQWGSEIVPITVFDVMNMGGCEINFTYDPTVVYVTDVARGDMNYSFEYNINNGSGWMRANALDAYGQSGNNVTFAHLTLTAVGNKSDVSEMEFEYSRLVDTSLSDITHVRDNGTFTIDSNELPVVTNVSATPDTILYDNSRPRTHNTTLLSAHVTDTDGNITEVTIDLSSIGGSPVQPMEHDDSGDVWTVITNATEVDINAPDFNHQLTITATDNDGGINNSVSIELTVLKRGDVTGDGLVDKADADYISRYLAGLEPEASNPPVKLVGDVVGEAGDPLGDGVVDLLDALYIAKYTSNLEEEP